AKLKIEGTYIERNEGTALRAINTEGSGHLWVNSSVLVPQGNNRLVRVTRSRALLLHNTFAYDNINSRPIAITEGNSTTRWTMIFGNIFDGNLPPVDVSNIDWVNLTASSGCSSFRQAHIGDAFYSAHAAARRLVGQVALQPGTYWITDPTSPVIDFCEAVAGGLTTPPGVDIAGLSRPFDTPNANVHGTWDLGAHEIRTGPFFTLTAARAGEGSLLSNPAGINCPGSCDASYPENTSVTVTATADPGWRFTGWDLGCAGNNPACTVVMNQNRTLVARFRQEFNLNIFLVGAGSVTIQPVGTTCASNCTEVFVDGTLLTLAANPAPGSTFAGWTGACSGLGACELTMSTNRSVAAEFVAGPGADKIFHDRFEP
ncbi:MAG: InlB B-repeat-containing protein, partial [Wenzhouxiangella sp.]